MKEKRIEIMETISPRIAVLKLALPTMLAMAVQMIYSMTDTFFIGQTGNPSYVAALSLASPIFLLNQALGNIFANGTSSYISRKLGAKDIEEAKHANSVGFYSSIGIGIIFTLLLLIFREPILNMIGVNAYTYTPTYEYYTVIALFAVPLILQASLAGLVRSEGSTGRAMIGMVLGIVINIVLDPIFILVFDMGIEGAAWATVIGATIGVIYFIGHFISKKTILSIHPKYFIPTKTIISETVRIGIPAALSTVVMSFSFVLVNNFAVSYGVSVVAAYGIIFRVHGLAIMMMMGLTQGYQPFAGYNFGACNYPRLKEGFLYTLVYATTISIFFTVLFAIKGEAIISLFIEDSATIEAGSTILHAYTYGLPALGIQFTMMVTFQAAGKALKAMLIALGRQLILYVPLLFILNALVGFNGFIFAQPVADILTTIIAAAMSISFIKELNGLNRKTLKTGVSYEV